MRDRRTEESILAYKHTRTALQRIVEPRPPEALPRREAAVVMAVLAGARTEAEVVAATGLSLFNAHAGLRRACLKGLLDLDTPGGYRTTMRVAR